ncbi:MAG: hypothetical protein LBU92_05305 [Prevotellaceae bacterium]|jgi:hypothetical protein|nr:hypothetical protein [Prevotellaceae bacterium]
MLYNFCAKVVQICSFCTPAAGFFKKMCKKNSWRLGASSVKFMTRKKFIYKSFVVENHIFALLTVEILSFFLGEKEKNS